MHYTTDRYVRAKSRDFLSSAAQWQLSKEVKTEAAEGVMKRDYF